ncbi:PepSY domain-containing protein [Dysgonomonas sp. 521]|uniref:PepSY-associated TM helix domain-containing protein n=1 Tax=Dysgonomonas sp. 521 TaxID=2302932 RepID=UPI0013D757D8|nr:PepSY-associated TM helix domain-containing protein [Dysgonomonas sp. 521]NDV95774.1 PepSY domain-containing protein [Dysgonomonas sp. 521]
MRIFLKKLHKWLSIPVGIIITIVCLTGAILVFQDEILELSNPSHYFIKDIKGNPMPLGELIPKANAQLEGNSVTSVQVSDDPARTYRMTLAEGFRVTAFVNQYTGEVTGIYKFRESPFYTVMTLHRWLMDGSHTWGKYTVGISTLLFVFILITGFIVWMPRRWSKSRFKVQLKKGKKRLFFDMHNVLGAYACLVLLICALTGMFWSFEWYRNGLYKIFGAEAVEARGHGGGRQQEDKKELNVSSWQTVLSTLQASNPDYEYIRIQDGSATIHQKSYLTSRSADQHKFDKRTGDIIETTLFKDQPKSTRVFAWVYSLHVGNYWGIWSKIFTCIFSLIGASLPLTGYYMFFVKRKSKQAVKKRKETKTA